MVRRAGHPHLWLMAALAAMVLAAVDTPTATAQQRPPELDPLLRKLDDLYRASSSESRAELTVTDSRRTRTLRLHIWTRGTDKALVVIDAPARERGTATLRVGDSLWNFLPRISRTIRVPPSMMLSSWMGSDFTNDDLVKESSYREDYTSEIVGPSRSPAGWLLRMNAREGAVRLWKRIDWVISPDELPIEARYYDRRDRLARTLRFTDVQDMHGRRIPTRMVLTPEDGDSRTELRYLDIDFNANVPESTFSLSRLERNR